MVPLDLANLTPEVRNSILAEIKDDIRANKLYLSSRLTTAGRNRFPDLLLETARLYDDSWLAARLLSVIAPTETYTRNRQVRTRKVPRNAHEALAEGEFNRFYMRGLCRYAIAHQIPELEVYRAKPVAHPRPESERLRGSRIPPEKLLVDLRANIGVDTALGIPGGPNSGLSVRIPK